MFTSFHLEYFVYIYKIDYLIIIFNNVTNLIII